MVGSQNRLTSSSNTWSFGVTCWEILGLCRQRPFDLLTDAEVVQNAEHICYSDTLQVIVLIELAGLCAHKGSGRGLGCC